MAKKKMKPKAKPLPAKKGQKGQKKPTRPSRGFDMASVMDKIDAVGDRLEALTDRVAALEQGDDPAPAEEVDEAEKDDAAMDTFVNG